MWHCQQRVGHDVLRAVHPPRTRLVQNLPLLACKHLYNTWQCPWPCSLCAYLVNCKLTLQSSAQVQRMKSTPLQDRTVECVYDGGTLKGMAARMRSKADCRSVVTITTLSSTSYVSRTLPWR